MDRRPCTARVREDEGGFTMIELMVALMVMATVMLSLLGVFLSGLDAAVSSSSRTAATALATRETEAMRAVAYDKLGFYGDQGAVAPPGADIVILAPTTPVGATPAIEPTTDDEEVRSVEYDIARYVVWADAEDDASSYSRAYKKTIVEVSWDDAGVTREVTQESIVYPGGRGPHVGPSTTTTTIPPSGAIAAPAIGTAAAVSTPPATPGDAYPGESQITVTWSPSTTDTVTHYIVEWSTDPTFNTGTATSTPQPDTATSFTVTDLAAATTYHIRVIAYAGAEERSHASASVSATTLAPTTTACTVSNLTVSGTGSGANQGLTTKTYLQQGNTRLTEDLSLVVTYTGTCTGTFSVRSTHESNSVADPGSPHTLTGTDATRTGTIRMSNSSWSTGVHRFTVLLNGSLPSTTVEKTMLFCADQKNPSADPATC